MKFSALVAIVPEDLEQKCIDAARDCGAGGITVMSGRGGISNTAKKNVLRPDLRRQPERAADGPGEGGAVA